MTDATTFTWDDKAASALLARLSKAGTDLVAPMRVIAHGLAQLAALSFHTQSDPWGSPWLSLAPATIAKRRGNGAGAAILRDTGQLMSSLADAATDTGAEIRIGFADRPATIHQFGGQAGRGHATTIPARPMLPIRADGSVAMPDDWRDVIVGAVNAHLEAAAR